MKIYLDASVIVPLLRPELATSRAVALLSGADIMVVSDFAVAETASALSRLVRSARLPEDVAHRRLVDFDLWRFRRAVAATTGADDVREATGFVLRFELMLRTPDALHLALARRAGAALATLDARLTRAALALGVPLAPIPA